ncbi:uncharacterized protein LOC115792932 [Archocentrus centrarchus]|uniref:uncharacterized protein LOC115792932 n=1 Tax=Archocentrus centrarchus TaxID=63155 RepID=UPI0011EA3346|nr:uncharacterized protein LOC115792932 [Archocentrus centrarchus]
MEKFVAVFAVLAALLAANVSVSEAQTEKKYFKAGGDLRLSPQKVSGSIFSIVWKYDKNLLAEWVEGSIDLTYYSKFKVRSELNIVTGDLVVHNMTSGDKGVYSVEINNQVQSLTYQTVEIQEVPKPTVELQPLVCHPTSGICRLICHGDVANAGPVSYFWKKDDGGWELSGDRKELSPEESNVKTFTCRMENPVSVEDSKPFNNPLYQEKKPADPSSSGPIVGGVVAVILVIVAVLCFLKRDLLRQKLPCLSSGSNLESPPNSEKPEDKKLLGVNNEPNNTGKSSSPTSADKADNTELGDVSVSKPPDTSDGKGEGGGAPTS